MYPMDKIVIKCFTVLLKCIFWNIFYSSSGSLHFLWPSITFVSMSHKKVWHGGIFGGCWGYIPPTTSLPAEWKWYFWLIWQIVYFFLFPKSVICFFRFIPELCCQQSFLICLSFPGWSSFHQTLFAGPFWTYSLGPFCNISCLVKNQFWTI